MKTLRAEVTALLSEHREPFEGESSSEEMMRRGCGRCGSERRRSVICMQATRANSIKT
jgi:hypothetical protein